MADKVIQIPGVGNVAFPDTMSDADISAQAARLYAQRPGERTRVDTNAIGVDHDALMQSIANVGSKLPRPLQTWGTAAMAFPADALASLAEMFSAPESVATMGAKPVATGMDVTAASTAAVRSALGRTPAMAAAQELSPELAGLISPRLANALKIAQRIKAGLTPTASPTPGRVVGRAPTVNDSIVSALEELRSTASGGSRGLPAMGDAQAATDTMRLLSEREALRSQPQPPTPPSVTPGRVAGRAPTLNDALMATLQDLRREMPTRLTLNPGGGDAQAGADTMRLLSEREAARRAATARPGSAPTTPATAATSAPVAETAASNPRPAPTPGSAVAAPLSQAEEAQALRWLEQGVDPDIVATRILSSRDLTGRLGTPTPDEAVRESARMADESERRSVRTKR